MDHTLLNDSSSLPSRFDDTLSLLNFKGIPFILASGRTLKSMKYKVKDIKGSITFISDNGAIIEHNNEILHVVDISKKDISLIQEVLKKCPRTTITAASINKSYAIPYDEEHAQFLYEYYPTYEVVTDLNMINDVIVKITTLTLDGNQAIYDQIIKPAIESNTNCRPVTSGKVWIDIMDKNVDKGAALGKLINLLDISSDSIATYGDYHNDIGMLQLAKYSHAVSNAHDDVKRVANKVIGSNNDEAVISSILDYLNNQEVL